jgi:hypothetical protein
LPLFCGTSAFEKVALLMERLVFDRVFFFKKTSSKKKLNSLTDRLLLEEKNAWAS